MMRVSLLYGIRDIRLENRPIPTPGAGEVLLKLAVVGICGSDVHYYKEGRIGSQVLDAPLSMGHEFSAWVVNPGPGVKDLHAGQLVAVDPAIACGICESCRQGHPNLCLNIRFCGTPPVDGVLGEYTLMPADNCFPLPDGVSAEEGALLEPLGIAIHSIDLAHIKAGNTVAVLGGGPIGLLTAAVAHVAGANVLVVTEPLGYRREFAAEYLGCAVLDPTQTDVVAEILQQTGGWGVDVAFEAAGATETPQQAAAVTRPGGKVILIGIPADDTITFNASTVRRKGLTIKLVRRMKHTYPRAIHLVQSGLVDVKSLATHHFPLEKVQDAMELVAGYRDGVLRAMIQISE